MYNVVESRETLQIIFIFTSYVSDPNIQPAGARELLKLLSVQKIASTTSNFLMYTFLLFYLCSLHCYKHPLLYMGARAQSEHRNKRSIVKSIYFNIII